MEWTARGPAASAAGAARSLISTRTSGSPPSASRPSIDRTSAARSTSAGTVTKPLIARSIVDPAASSFCREERNRTARTRSRPSVMAVMTSSSARTVTFWSWSGRSETVYSSASTAGPRSWTGTLGSVVSAICERIVTRAWTCEGRMETPSTPSSGAGGRRPTVICALWPGVICRSRSASSGASTTGVSGRSMP